MNQEKNNSGFITRIIFTVIICIAAYTGGAIFGAGLDKGIRDILGYCALGGLLIVLILIALNALFAHLYKKRMDVSVREGRKLMLSRQEEADKSLKKATRKIIILRVMIDIYSFFVLLIGIGAAFCMGAGQSSAILTLFPAYLILGFFNRIQLVRKNNNILPYTSPEKFPIIYEIAYKAQKAVKMKGKIKILFIDGSNAGIARVDDFHSLYLGVGLLDMLNEDELYNVLIHEFCHRTKDGNPRDREYRLFTYITESDDAKINFFCNRMFIFPDLVFAFEYMMYRAVSSRAVEYIADTAITKYGDPKIAASALTKLAYAEHFNREFPLHITESFYFPESKRKNASRLISDTFRRVITERQKIWDSIIEKEIEPKSSTHPITRDRIKAMGVSDFTVLPFPVDGEYYGECQKAMEALDLQAYESDLDKYSEQREEMYLKPLKIVEEWRKEEKTVTPEDARPVMDALLTLGLTDELYALCDKIIASNDNKFLTAHAYMLRGKLRLLNYNNEGIEDIYTAVEANSNYIDTGLELIGEYCCICGLQEQLDIYRERSIDFQQDNIDKYSKADTLEFSDNLIPDTMPREMLDDILAFMKGVSEDIISQIYLVRKQITEDFFVSAFVVRFDDSADEELINETMDKIFYHLDTRPEDWQFALHLFGPRVSAAVNKVQGSCVYYKNKQTDLNQ